MNEIPKYCGEQLENAKFDSVKKVWYVRCFINNKQTNFEAANKEDLFDLIYDACNKATIQISNTMFFIYFLQDLCENQKIKVIFSENDFKVGVIEALSFENNEFTVLFQDGTQHKLTIFTKIQRL